MSITFTSTVRNVNEALRRLVSMSHKPSLWRDVSPRGMQTLEFRGVFVTEYTHPQERVLFNTVRDANPFFHLMEALWIMDGRDDVAFLNQFNSNISTFSDDGKTFNAPYGYRLRKHFKDTRAGAYDYDRGSGTIEGAQPFDQLTEVIALLQRDPDTRRAVLCLWDPVTDLNRESKDIPCNDLVCFKLREGILDMTVMNRSNDAVWGAYGANAVQFSFLHEFVACALNCRVGTYRQISDSFHVYTNQAAWQRLQSVWQNDDQSVVDSAFENPYIDRYGRVVFDMLPMMPRHVTEWEPGVPTWLAWLEQNHLFLNDSLGKYQGRLMPFFHSLAVPVMTAWRVYKGADIEPDKNERIEHAQEILINRVEAQDWAAACVQWLQRRRGGAA